MGSTETSDAASGSLAPRRDRDRDRDRIVVVGQAARDLVLGIDALPEAEGSTPVSERIERLGGKGANLAAGLRQLNPATRVTLVAVLGTDASGAHAFDDAADSGLDVDHVVRRGRTALLVDLVESDGTRRLLEDVPPEAELTTDDVIAAVAAMRDADTVVLQLQQPAEALLAAARAAVDAGARLALDGAIGGAARDELLAEASVVRADAREAALLTGIAINDLDAARRAAGALLAHGPDVAAVAVPGAGDLVAWPGGERFFPFAEHDRTDRTGAGDAFVAGLVMGLRRGDAPEAAGRLAADAASSTVQRLGGRPDLGHLVARHTTRPEETRDA
ncbi:PfkB family carbohydrate kinase [Agromyces aerolatus]|uniref:PfkB family carbohydrate kinase n=1 Tax=Agromyces sp. LY-1074 TaxID=3074080 RepID=UPI0028598623|nr:MULTISPECIES: PfkB family carbohydrate kinase [unclassified Agromyces]MDR5699572.1 PfkB family carbohydrate kinase [Agromyces sp. LY-1074]MDR5705868.1 PfkB family carbohydrate kinase [Agromyces sp. LY-1358]